MTVSTPAQLMDLACDLLATAAACLTENDLAVPDNVYVSPCPPDLFCCSNLVVTPGEIRIIEEPGPSQGRCLVRRELHFDLWIERCVHVFAENGSEPPLGSCDEPAGGTVAGDALKVLTDRWVILQCLVDHLRGLDSDASLWCCHPVSIVAVEAVCEGSCAGTRFEVTLTI